MLLLAIVLSVATLDPAAGGDEAARAAMQQAASTMAAGEHARATEAFLAVADDHPSAPQAADALLKAGQLLEERLGDPQRALAVYRRLTTSYPDSRAARRARQRVEALRDAIGADGAHADAVAAFRDVLERYPERPRAESIRRMQQVVDAHPEAPIAGEAALWLGVTLTGEGRISEALRWLERARVLTDDARLKARAVRAAGDAHLARSDFDAAERAYRSLTDSPDPATRTTGAASLRAVDQARTRHRRAQLAWLVIAAVLVAMSVSLRRAAGSWRASARALLRPPGEVLYFAPVAAALMLLAASSNELVAGAVYVIAGGGVVITWLTGAVVEAHRRRGRLGLARALGHAALAVIAVAGLCYVAFVGDRLLDMLAETVRHGHEH